MTAILSRPQCVKLKFTEELYTLSIFVLFRCDWVSFKFHRENCMKVPGAGADGLIGFVMTSKTECCLNASIVLTDGMEGCRRVSMMPTLSSHAESGLVRKVLWFEPLCCHRQHRWSQSRQPLMRPVTAKLTLVTISTAAIDDKVVIRSTFDFQCGMLSLLSSLYPWDLLQPL